MLGRTPASIEVVRPVRHGVIADLDVCTRMLRFMFLQVHPRRWSRPKMVMVRALRPRRRWSSGRCRRRPRRPAAGGPSSWSRPTSPPRSASASRSTTPGAAWWSCVGGGRTEVAVLSLGGVVARKSLRLGGMDFDEAIVDWVKKEHGLALGERTAEELKIQVGSAGPARPEAARASRDDAPTTTTPRSGAATSSPACPARS